MKYRIALASAAVALLVASTAYSSITQPVYKALRGRILVTERPLPPPLADDRETTRAYTALHRSSVKSTVEDEEATWRFHYTAFLRTPLGATKASIDVYAAGGAYVTSTQLLGLDKSARILGGQARFTDSEGIVAGKTYEFRVVVARRGKDRVLSVARLKLR